MKTFLISSLAYLILLTTEQGELPRLYLPEADYKLNIPAYIREEAKQAGVNPNVAVAIARCESGADFNPLAKNPNSSASGVFQILKIHGLGESVFDPIVNIDWAIAKMSKEGFGAWEASRGCWSNTQ